MDIQETLRHYIINEALNGQEPAGFDDDYDLIDSGTIDSLFMMNLVAYLEQEHHVEFGMNDMVPKHFKSVKALAEFVKSKTN
ncbi:phosphopantetheine-binding protein [Candidatus Thiothrix sp. Deng01]|uniref:Phosphopantetheine-binding protein n=1 Tax=Candidatus Thiothrix phosphatis TaxID=3112415 RepID=A0ABU6D104_9GAMM|nr:phosphopantetheine-binding protein [Candidatus Thiothrix sp. Deng01]MEB4592752.1 phosphopantetheine-binding protein [Candidatus Thiothrix sp. Deng01]